MRLFPLGMHFLLAPLILVVGCQQDINETVTKKVAPFYAAIKASGFEPVLPPRGGLEPGAIWEIKDHHPIALIESKPAHLALQSPQPISFLRSVEFDNNELSAAVTAQFLGADIRATLGSAKFKSIVVDFGDAMVTDVQVSDFSRKENASWFDASYREDYDDALNHKSGKVVFHSVYWTQNLRYILSGSDKQTADLVASIATGQTAKTQGQATFTAKAVGNHGSDFEISTSGTRTVVFAYSVASGLKPVAPVSPPPPVVEKKIEYALIWRNHYEPNTLYQVNRTDIAHREIANDQFKTWCTPFNLGNRRIVSQVEVAGDEHFKVSPGRAENWWIQSPYNLPPLIERWFQIMDDERWYVFTLESN